MKVFVCTDHAGHYPVGVASVVMAETEEQAAALLRDELVRVGLSPRPFTLEEVPETAHAQILNDGNY